MITELFQPDLLLIKSNGTLKDQNDFFAALYNRQESWNINEGKEIDISYLGKYSPDRHSGTYKTRSFPLNAQSWVEFQSFIDTAYGIGLFINGWVANLNAITLNYYLTKAGLYQRPTLSNVPITTLTATDGTVLATGIVTPTNWAAQWNALRVPYERAHSNSKFQYIKNLNLVGENPLFFRYNTLLFNGTA